MFHFSFACLFDFCVHCKIQDYFYLSSAFSESAREAFEAYDQLVLNGNMPNAIIFGALFTAIRRHGAVHSLVCVGMLTSCAGAVMDFALVECLRVCRLVFKFLFAVLSHC